MYAADMDTAVAARPRFCTAPVPGQSWTTSSDVSESEFSELAGHATVPNVDSGRRKTALPLATATWPAGHRVVAVLLLVSKASRTVSLRTPLGKMLAAAS